MRGKQAGGRQARAKTGARRAPFHAGQAQFRGHGSSCAGLSTVQQHSVSRADSSCSEVVDSPAQHDSSCASPVVASAGTMKHASASKLKAQPHKGRAIPDGRIHPGSKHAKSNQRASMALARLRALKRF